MVASLINNAIQVYLDSVFSMEDEGMVQMFKALESSGLRGFLGCSSSIYEAVLVDFYHNASVQDNKVISSIQGKSVEISEEQFVGIFELPTKGLTDMNEVPKDLVFDARSAFSTDGEQLKTSCKKREMKFEFRLLNDILAKTITVKAGSFDAVTHERRNPTLMLTDYRREMSSRSTFSSSRVSKKDTKRSVLARGVQRYHSYFSRSYIPSAIGEDKAPDSDQFLEEIGTSAVGGCWPPNPVHDWNPNSFVGLHKKTRRRFHERNLLAGAVGTRCPTVATGSNDGPTAAWGRRGEEGVYS
ncbi:hypothetical protein F511_04530 [Dorcoceras hygrometricum]|uniref:Uncharacterized protein n=1 Tax=Dorcoceras hygrometricum TaxID=472368 RepID=A0A2Z7C640_9LAMI|nr:hypothetical protein F511_04530 [Dorcoceras hygrometricum]